MSTRFVIVRIDELLRPLGFTRHKAIWNRRTDAFVDVIDVQTSKAGNTMTINAGVLHRDVYRKCWATEAGSVVEEPSCTVRVRVGQLLDGKDLWWRLTDARILDDVAAKVTAYVVPFLERMHSFEAMEAFLNAAQVTKHRYPPPIIYLALLKGEQGDRAGACELLTELREKSIGAWRTRISEIAGRLGCSAP